MPPNSFSASVFSDIFKLPRVATSLPGAVRVSYSPHVPRELSISTREAVVNVALLEALTGIANADSSEPETGGDRDPSPTELAAWERVCLGDTTK